MYGLQNLSCWPSLQFARASSINSQCSLKPLHVFPQLCLSCLPQAVTCIAACEIEDTKAPRPTDAETSSGFPSYVVVPACLPACPRRSAQAWRLLHVFAAALFTAIATALAFREISRTAGLLMVPYISFLVFANALNFQVSLQTHKIRLENLPWVS